MILFLDASERKKQLDMQNSRVWTVITINMVISRIAVSFNRVWIGSVHGNVP